MPEKIKADEQLKAVFSTAKQAEIEKAATAWQAEVQKYQEGAAKFNSSAKRS